MSKIALITVNYNGEKDTLELLESLKKLDTNGLEVKTVVVDNGSGDNLAKTVLEKYPEVVLLQNGQNLGFSGGFNRGLRYGMAWEADYFLIVNNDALISDPDLLIKLITTSSSQDDIGIVAPKIYFAPGYEFHKDRYKKEEVGKVIWYGGGEFDWDNVMSKHLGIDEVDNGQFNEVKEIGFVSGCCLLIKKEVLEKAGFLDERFFAYFEDNDYQQKAIKKGFKLFYDGSTSIYHKVSQTSGIGSPTSDYYVTRNRLYFGMEYASLRTKFALLRQALKFLLSGRKMQKKGVMDFLMGKTGGLPDSSRVNENAVFAKELSLVSSNYNTTELIKNLTASILDKKSGFDPKTMEIIILDDSSPNDPTSEIKQYFDRVQFFRNKENKGFTRSFNRLIHLAQGKYVLVLNSDVELLDDTITEIVTTEHNFNGQAVLGGRLYFPDMRSQDSVYFLPTPWGAIKEYFFNKKGSYFMFVPKPEVLTKVEGIVGACMLIPRIVFNKVGFFNEGMVSYFEDIDFCRRFKNNDIPVYFVPTAKFIHHHGASFKTLGDKTTQIHQESAKKFHGKFNYLLLYITLWLSQKITRKKPPGSM
jgi:GT2 family glycosyltransferase